MVSGSETASDYAFGGTYFDQLSNRLFSSKDLPTVAVEWLVILFRILEVPGSDLVPETRYPD